MKAGHLNLLATFLRNEVPERNFNLAFWRGGYEQSDTALLNHKCGTTACAVGWACAMPEFKAEGLRDAAGAPVYMGHGGWDAVEAFFDLSYGESVALFSLDHYTDSPEPWEVADRIEQFIEQPEYVLKMAREAYDENERFAIGDDEDGEEPEEDEEDEDDTP
jgi:hypothetical protein